MIANLALIGCGRMGGALLRGWQAAKLARVIHVVEPMGLPPSLAQHDGLILYPNMAAFAAAAAATDIVVLAVKPQVMDEACAPLAPLLPDGALVLSIAAGRTIASFERLFGGGRAIVRTMPNTPAMIGQGMSVACANLPVTAAQRAQADALLRAVGHVSWLADEALMDAATALVGNGPAYVFLLIEVLAKAAVALGVPAADAPAFARQTVIGAAALAATDAATPPATLRENVTSPGGTTEAALAVLMAADGMQPLFDRALAAGAARAKELSK